VGPGGLEPRTCGLESEPARVAAREDCRRATPTRKGVSTARSRHAPRIRQAAGVLPPRLHPRMLRSVSASVRASGIPSARRPEPATSSNATRSCSRPAIGPACRGRSAPRSGTSGRSTIWAPLARSSGAERPDLSGAPPGDPGASAPTRGSPRPAGEGRARRRSRARGGTRRASGGGRSPGSRPAVRARQAGTGP